LILSQFVWLAVLSSAALRYQTAGKTISPNNNEEIFAVLVKFQSQTVFAISVLAISNCQRISDGVSANFWHFRDGFGQPKFGDFCNQQLVARIYQSAIGFWSKITIFEEQKQQPKQSSSDVRAMPKSANHRAFPSRTERLKNDSSVL
jgi:hypothetical protein